MRPVRYYRVRLSPERCAQADAEAVRRHEEWKDKADASGGRAQKLEDQIIGCRGELAVALALGLQDFWPAAGPRYDVGSLQVRTRSEEWMEMLLDPWRGGGFHPDDPYVLARRLDPDLYLVGGWCWGREYVSGRQEELGYRRPKARWPWLIQVDKLRPMGTLPGFEAYVPEEEAG